MMKKILLSNMCCLLISLTASPQQKKADTLPCESSARSQVELNNCAHLIFMKADAEMNRVYQQLMKSLAEDGEQYQRKLRVAQQAWLRYRDANCESEAALNEGGTIYPMVYNYCLASLTEERTGRMKEILKGEER